MSHKRKFRIQAQHLAVVNTPFRRLKIHVTTVVGVALLPDDSPTHHRIAGVTR